MRRVGTRSAGFAAVALLVAAGVARAQSSPPDDNGRYTLSETDSGYLRLDTRTGAVSICTRKSGWTCRVVPDERAALDQEIGHLQEQVGMLKAQLANRGDTVPREADEPLARSDTLKKNVPDKSAEGAPPASPQDKLAAALDQIWRHLVEIALCVRKMVSNII